jgi:cell fate regulator YaaT (PSP1 superfamily)
MEKAAIPLKVVGIRFSIIGKIYNFEGSKIIDLRVGDTVVVETSRGWQLGQIVEIFDNLPPAPEGGWKSIDRKATPRDLLQRQNWQRKETEVLATCRARVTELSLSGIKIISAEYSFEGSRLAILFSSEAEDKIAAPGYAKIIFAGSG